MAEWKKQHMAASSVAKEGVQEEAKADGFASQLQAQTQAKLEMTIFQGKQLRDAQDFIGKMNPFVVVEVNDKKYRTQIKYDEHTNPVWNKTINFPVQSMGDTVLIYC